MATLPEIKTMEARAETFTADEVEVVRRLYAQAVPRKADTMGPLMTLYNGRIGVRSQSPGCQSCRNKVYQDIEHLLHTVWATT